MNATQATLFDRVPYSNQTTSRDAAVAIRPQLARLELTVLEEIIRSSSGATCDEIEQNTGLAHQTASARVRGLRLRGLIVDTGLRRNTRSGRKAIVWRVAFPEAVA